jgi:hypothetical protein
MSGRSANSLRNQIKKKPSKTEEKDARKWKPLGEVRNILFGEGRERALFC